MKLVVIESPYAGNVWRHIAYAREALLNSLASGEAPIVSHLLHTQVLDDGIPDERSRGILAGHAWIPRADLVAVYCDYGISRGMQAGIDFAVSHKIPVEYRRLYAGNLNTLTDARESAI